MKFGLSKLNNTVFTNYAIILINEFIIFRGGLIYGNRI